MKRLRKIQMAVTRKRTMLRIVVVAIGEVDVLRIIINRRILTRRSSFLHMLSGGVGEVVRGRSSARKRTGLILISSPLITSSNVHSF